MLDDLPYARGIAVAVDDDEFDLLGREGVVQFAGPVDPVTMRGMAAVAERTVDECDVVLIFGQYGYGNAVGVVQCAVLACLGTSVRVTIFS